MSKVDAIMERTQWDFFFAPPDTRIVDRPEVLYCHTPRDLGHLNCVVRARLADCNREAAIDEVCAAHVGVTSEWLVHAFLEDRALGPALASRCYQPVIEHRAYATGPHIDICAPENLSVTRVDSMKGFIDGELVFSRAFAHRSRICQQEAKRGLALCADPARRIHRFVAYEDGTPVSFGAMTLFPALGFAMLWRGCTVPEARGRGAYRAILKQRLRFAAQAGVRLVGLYAQLETSAPIVERLGFTGHGYMTLWAKPA